MSIHSICFLAEIRKCQYFLVDIVSFSATMGWVCMSSDVHCMKRALIQFADNAGSVQRAYLCSLHILQLFVDIYYIILIFCKWTVQVLISLRLCAG